MLTRQRERYHHFHLSPALTATVKSDSVEADEARVAALEAALKKTQSPNRAQCGQPNGF
jgi:hypothetical protein